jgi:uncharacterized integral membrane protein
MADQERAPRRQGAQGRSGAEFARLLLAVAGGGLIAAFAVLNTGEVKVNWVFGTFRTPLIIVILVCLGIGLAVGLAGGWRGKGAKKRRADRQ